MTDLNQVHGANYATKVFKVVKGIFMVKNCVCTYWHTGSSGAVGSQDFHKHQKSSFSQLRG